jgi:hypothetical protein
LVGWLVGWGVGWGVGSSRAAAGLHAARMSRERKRKSGSGKGCDRFVFTGRIVDQFGEMDDTPPLILTSLMQNFHIPPLLRRGDSQ